MDELIAADNARLRSRNKRLRRAVRLLVDAGDDVDRLGAARSAALIVLDDGVGDLASMRFHRRSSDALARVTARTDGGGTGAA